MSVAYWPEDTPSEGFCHMEGHNWGREGGVCQNCGKQLRCGACMRFVTIESLHKHIEEDCPVKWIEMEGAASSTTEDTK
jgi:hypothetical protein